LIDRLACGGTEIQLLELLHHLDRTQVEPILCLLDGDDAISQSLEPVDCEVHRIGVRSLLSPSTLGQVRRFSKWLHSRRIDLLQVHFIDSSYFGIAAAKLARIPVIRTRRNSGYWQGTRDRWLGCVSNWLSHSTIANCAAAKEAVIAQEFARPESVVVISNGINTERFADIPELSTSWGQRAPRIGAVANLRAVKGLDTLVRAAAQVIRRFPQAEFVVAGEGEQRGALERLIAQEDLQHRFHLVGASSDIPQFLSTLDIAVLPSQSEGLSNSLLEYMAAGRAVIATAVGGNTELISNERNGLLVSANDPGALADSIVRYLADPGFAANMGRAARVKILQEHAWTAATGRMVHHYRALMGSRPS